MFAALFACTLRASFFLPGFYSGFMTLHALLTSRIYLSPGAGRPRVDPQDHASGQTKEGQERQGLVRAWLPARSVVVVETSPLTFGSPSLAGLPETRASRRARLSGRRSAQRTSRTARRRRSTRSLARRSGALLHCRCCRCWFWFPLRH